MSDKLAEYAYLGAMFILAACSAFITNAVLDVQDRNKSQAHTVPTVTVWITPEASSSPSPTPAVTVTMTATPTPKPTKAKSKTNNDPGICFMAGCGLPIGNNLYIHIG